MKEKCTSTLVWIVLLALLFVPSSEESSIMETTAPRFENEFAAEVTYTVEHGATLDCVASGRPPPKINWLTSASKGGEGGVWAVVAEMANVVRLLTNGSLSVAPFRPQNFRPDIHSVAYKCTASNALGKIVSPLVRIRPVILAPFVAIVADAKVERGSTAVFRCSVPEAVRDHVVVTSWIQDNRHDIFLTSSQDGRHVMLPNGDLHVLSVRSGDEGHFYNCRFLVRPNGQTRISITSGRLQLLTDVAMKMAPVIVESSDLVRTWRGQDAVLPCVYRGFPHPRVKWYRNTAQYEGLAVPVHHGGRFRLVGGTLVIRSMHPEDEGRYHCIVNSSAGMTEARSELLMREKLQVRLDPSSQLIVDAEKNAVLTCSWTGSPKPTAVWLKNGQSYVSDDRVRTSSYGNVAQLELTSVSPQDQGVYQCLVFSEDDSAQDSVHLRIGAFPPQMKETFSRHVLQPGTSVSLRCVIYGIPTPHLTWLLDDVPVPVSDRYFLGQQNGVGKNEIVSHLNISDVRVQDSGNYKCVAENRVGRVEFSAALLVYGPPYVRPMGSVLAVGGRRLEVPCPVAGYPIETFVWDKDGRRLPSNQRQRIQFNGTLTIEAADKSADTGIYTCEARGPNKISARQSFSINVIDGPHIMTMPDMVVVTAGERLALQCAVIKGGLPLALTWRKEEASTLAVVSGLSIKLINDFTVSLTVESLTDQHAGRYTCLARNDAGRAHFTVTVVVQASPRINPFRMSHVMVNARLQISCVIEEGDPPLTIRWFRNGRPLHANSPAHQSTSPDSSSSVIHFHHPLSEAELPELRVTDFNAYSSILTIDRVSLAHGGNYSCLAENAAGFALHAALLHVSVPPLWTSPPTDVQSIAGRSVEISCPVYGVPTPQLTWLFTKERSSEKYLTVFNSNRTLLTNQSLVISPVDQLDEGFYHCEASNGVGNSISAIVSLLVHVPPEVKLNVDYVAVRRGSGTVLRCTATGDVPLGIQWRKDGSPVDPSIRPRMVSQTNLSAASGNGVLKSEFSIANAAPSDEALYECRATNIYGEDSTTIFVQIQDIPHAPSDLRVKELTSRQVTIEWKAPPDGGSPIQEYNIFYKGLLDTNDAKVMRQEHVPASQTSALIKALQPATAYQIYVTATNAMGQGVASVWLSVTTDEEIPDGPPLDLRMVSVSSRDIKLVWSPPDPTLCNGVLIGYDVSVHQVADELNHRSLNRTLVSVVTTQSGDNLEHRVSGLKPDTNYMVSVQAVNSRGKGPASEGLTARTLEDVPEEAPTNVACVALSSQSLQITWKPPGIERRNGVLRGYRLFFGKTVNEGELAEPTEPDHSISSMTTTELTLTLLGLHKYSNYTVQVLAFTGAGDGERSPALICTTQEDLPEAPTPIKIVQSGVDSIIISWVPSLRPNGHVLRYTIYCKEQERMSGKDTNVLRWTADAPATRSEVRNLRHHAVFYFQVSATTRAGEGGRSPTASFNFNAGNKIGPGIVSIGSELVAPRWSRIQLPCDTVGDAPLQVAWFEGRRQVKDWSSLIPFRDLSHTLSQPWITVNNASEDASGANVHSQVQVHANGSLSIDQLTKTSGGNYTCRVRNRHGEDSISHFLAVLVPPSAPELQFVSSDWSSVTLQWSTPRRVTAYDGDIDDGPVRVAPVRGFVLRHRPRSTPLSQPPAAILVGLQSLTLTVPNLLCGTEYEFSLLATSHIGNSSSSTTVTARTKGASPEHIAVDQVSDLVVAATSCTIYLSNWQDQGCPISQFLVRFRAVGDGSDWIIAGGETPPQQAFLLGGLRPSTAYMVRVTASNAAGAAHRDYAFTTDGAPDDYQWYQRGHQVLSSSSLTSLLTDARVFVPIAVSVLALFLTAITLILRYHYRSQYTRPSSQPVEQRLPRQLTDDDDDEIDVTDRLRHGGSTLSVVKRVASEYGDDDVSPYAVFSMPALPPTYSSARRMKTFVVNKAHQPLEMNNYATPDQADADAYDYIAPDNGVQNRYHEDGADGRHHQLRRVTVSKINPQSLFVPIVATPRHGRRCSPTNVSSRTFQRSTPVWDNQETIALSHRL